MGVIGLLGADPTLDQAVAHGKREAEVGLPLGVYVLWQFRQRNLKVGQELPPDGVGVQTIDIGLLQILRCEVWGRSGGCSHHATPLSMLNSLVTRRRRAAPARPAVIARPPTSCGGYKSFLEYNAVPHTTYLQPKMRSKYVSEATCRRETRDDCSIVV